MKVLFLPNNTASLMNLSVSALRDKGVDAVGFNFTPMKFQTNSEVHTLPDDFFQRIIFVMEFIYNLLTCDRIHWIYGGNSKLGIALQYFVGLFVWKKKFVEFCGTDVRILEKIIEDVPDYRSKKFSLEQERLLGTKVTSLKTQQRFSLLKFEALGNSPEIMDYIDQRLFPVSYEIPRAIDTMNLKPVKVSNKIPVVIHLPSSPEIKGTEIVNLVCHELAEKDVIQFRNLHGLSHREVLEEMKRSDVVIDQLLIGEFGVVTLEALALNKKVVCFLRPGIEQAYRKRFPSFPVVNANAANLKEILLKLVSSSHELDSNNFIETNYSRAARANRLLEIYRK
jgi:hypothetical protein